MVAYSNDVPDHVNSLSFSVQYKNLEDRIISIENDLIILKEQNKNNKFIKFIKLCKKNSIKTYYSVLNYFSNTNNTNDTNNDIKKPI
jgi:rRNA maturation protein Rpf1